MWRSILVLAVISLALLLRPPGVAAGEALDIGLDRLIGAAQEDPVKTALEEAEREQKGDNKEYTIRTDDDISTLKPDDILTNGQKTYFKVVSVNARGTEGGSFVMRRIGGNTEPDRKLTRFHATDPKAPPLTISITHTLLDQYFQGGWPMHIISALAIIAIVMLANSIWLYRPSRHYPAAFVQQARQLLASGNITAFEELALRTRGLFAQICRAIAYQFGSSTMDDIKTRVEAVAGKHVNRLRLPVKVLNFCAGASPLVGLMGTIYGMIIVFEAVAATTGASKAAALAAGIRVKLFCTLFALTVAIPSLFAYFLFNHVFSVIVSNCQVLAEQFLQIAAALKNGKMMAAPATAATPLPAAAAPAPMTAQAAVPAMASAKETLL